MTDLHTRISALLAHLRRGIYEKETETALALLAALAGENILLLGPPGVAKSMVARRLKCAFHNARAFEYLMSRFSTPDELFGPVSIARLKESDRYERATEGYLPTADVVFLDEIWKAGPAIQNTLLTVMNEKVFRNGDREERLPLKLLVAASNELPAKGEGLEALWDRFAVRLICRNIGDEATFRRMLTDTAPDTTATDEAPEAITAETYARWQAEAREVSLSPALLEAITLIRHALTKVTVEGSELARSVYVSDRRWKHIAALLRTSALIHGRREAGPEDLMPLHHCLWNEPEEREAVCRIVCEAVWAPLADEISRLAADVKTELRAKLADRALREAAAAHDHTDDGLAVIDRLYYQIDNHGTGHTYIFITDYKQLPPGGTPRAHDAAPAKGVIYKDPDHAERRIVRLYRPQAVSSRLNAEGEAVTLARSQGYVYLNGVRYALRREGAATLNPATGRVEDAPRSASAAPRELPDYDTALERLCEATEGMGARLEANLFASKEDKHAVKARLQELYKQIALTRADLSRLLYDH